MGAGMSEDNVEIMRRGYEAYAERGVDGFLEYIHPDFELVTPPGLALEPQTYRGHEGVRRYFDSFYEAVDEIRVEPDEFIAVGDRVLVPFRLTTRGRASGIEASMRAVQVCEIRDGKAVRFDIYPTLEEARTAAEGAA
jgi:ketosteroid isomerase-like protein